MQQDFWSVQLPSDLAGELTLEGFDVAGMRGTLDQALAVSTIGANLLTILVAKDKVAELVRGVRAWMTRRTAAPEGSEFVLALSAHNGSQQHELRVVARRTEAGAPPRIDTAALETLLTSMLDDEARGAPEHTE